MWLRHAAVVPLAVACLCAWTAWRHARTRRQAANWPVARARVVQSRVETCPVSIHSRPKYAPRVVYEFRAGKRLLRADSLIPEGPVFTTSLERAEREAAHYPVGAPIRIRYNPANPQQSYLANPGQALGIGMWVAGAAAFTAGAALIWWIL